MDKIDYPNFRFHVKQRANKKVQYWDFINFLQVLVKFLLENFLIGKSQFNTWSFVKGKLFAHVVWILLTDSWLK